jgi:hypothetical protein
MLPFVRFFRQFIPSAQIWTDKSQWEGFVLLASNNVPASFPVLLQLPAAVLDAALRHRHMRADVPLALARYAVSDKCAVPVFKPVRAVLQRVIDAAAAQHEAAKRAASDAAAAASAAAASAAAAAVAEAAALVAAAGAQLGHAELPPAMQAATCSSAAAEAIVRAAGQGCTATDTASAGVSKGEQGGADAGTAVGIGAADAAMEEEGKEQQQQQQQQMLQSEQDAAQGGDTDIALDFEGLDAEDTL